MTIAEKKKMDLMKPWSRVIMNKMDKSAMTTCLIFSSNPWKKALLSRVWWIVAIPVPSWICPTSSSPVANFKKWKLMRNLILINFARRWAPKRLDISWNNRDIKKPPVIRKRYLKEKQVIIIAKRSTHPKEQKASHCQLTKKRRGHYNCSLLATSCVKNKRYTSSYSTI